MAQKVVIKTLQGTQTGFESRLFLWTKSIKFNIIMRQCSLLMPFFKTVRSIFYSFHFCVKKTTSEGTHPVKSTTIIITGTRVAYLHFNILQRSETRAIEWDKPTAQICFQMSCSRGIRSRVRRRRWVLKRYKFFMPLFVIFFCCCTVFCVI